MDRRKDRVCTLPPYHRRQVGQDTVATRVVLRGIYEYDQRSYIYWEHSGRDTEISFRQNLFDIQLLSWCLCIAREREVWKLLYAKGWRTIKTLEGGVWCNPPYGREISSWVKKAYEESQKEYNSFVLMLLPARTDTRWWWEYVQGKATLFFIKGRVKFGDHNVGAPSQAYWLSTWRISKDNQILFD